MGLSRKPNLYGLDPFLIVDTAKANYYFGRTDIEPDTEDGQRRAVLSAARGENPELDKSLPWMLLSRGMFKFLYKEAIAQDNKRRGVKKRIPGDRLPSPIHIPPHKWAEAFNIITVSYVQNEFFLRPREIREQETASGRTVALALLVQDPGKGIAKSESYLRPEQRRETINTLRRFERHRLELGDSKEVQKHLASLRDLQVSR